MLSNAKIGEAIKKARESKKLTQKELGEIIDKTESSIRKYENGSVEIPLSVFEALSKALDVPTLELISSGLKRDFQDADITTVEKLVFYENLCNLYFNGVISWSTDKFIENIEDSILLQAHFSDLLGKYKRLTESYAQLVYMFNHEVKTSEEYIEASAHDKMRMKEKFFEDALEGQLENISHWIKIFAIRIAYQ